MKILKAIIKCILNVLTPLLLIVLPLVCMGIGMTLFMLPGIIIGSITFDEIPSWFGILFIAFPAGGGMYFGLIGCGKFFDNCICFKKADKHIDNGVYGEYMNK